MVDAKEYEYEDTKGLDPIGFVKDPCPEIPRGILLGDHIEKYIVKLNPPLIDPCLRENIRAASYDLRLGNEYYQHTDDGIHFDSADFKKLTDDNQELTIPAHGLVVVTTLEELHMPRYLVGRWNLRLRLVYRGILWSGAAQVDPGFSGKLSCPLFNLSSQDVTIRRGDRMFSIDFEKTNEYTKESHQFRFGKDREKPGVDMALIPNIDLRKLSHQSTEHPLASSVLNLSHDITSVQKESRAATEKLEDTKEKLEERISGFESNMFLVLSIIFAAIALVGFEPLVTRNVVPSPNLILLLFFVYATLALVLSILGLIVRRKSELHQPVSKSSASQ